MSDRYSRAGSNTVTEPEPVDPANRLRVLLGAALGSALTSYLLMGTVAALAGLSAGASPEPSALLTVGVPLWLAANQVPLTLAGAPLSMLPLLPTIAVAALAANFAAAAIGKLGRRWGGEAAWVVFALAGSQGSLAILGTALPIDPVQAQPWQALLGGGLVAGAGAAAGVLREVGLPERWRTAPHWVRVALSSGGTGAVGLLTAGALLLFSALAAASVTVHDGFDARPGWGAGIGITVLCLSYLPNALVAAVSWLAGPGLDIGAATASPVAVTVGPLPPVPLMAAMPTSQPPGWAAAVFILPVAVGVLVGLGCRQADADAMVRLRAVWVAILSVGLGFAVLASVAGGRLAGGPFDPVDLAASGNALALMGWLGVPAMVTVLLPAELGRKLRRKRVLSVEEAVAGAGAGALGAGSGVVGSGSRPDGAEPDAPRAADASDRDEGVADTSGRDRTDEDPAEYAEDDAAEGPEAYAAGGRDEGAAPSRDEQFEDEGPFDEEPRVERRAYDESELYDKPELYSESELYDESELYIPRSSTARPDSAPTGSRAHDVAGDTASDTPGSVG